jgi:endogenous inhibitor of DNA gyrase (YacG/DUF329 family)
MHNFAPTDISKLDPAETIKIPCLECQADGNFTMLSIHAETFQQLNGIGLKCPKCGHSIEAWIDDAGVLNVK